MIEVNELKPNENDRMKKIAAIMIPITYFWVMTGLFVLVYFFDMMDYVKSNKLLLFNNDFLLLAIWGIPAGFAASFTGMLIDKYPFLLKKLVKYSMLGYSISVILDMIALQISSALFMYVAVGFIGLFTGLLIISAQTLFGSKIIWYDRGKFYSIVMCIFGITTFILIFLTALFEMDFFLPLFLMSILGIILFIVFSYLIKKFRLGWEREKYPTPTRLDQILTRRSVILYFWSHTLIWIMLGLMIGSLAQLGSELGITNILSVELGAYKAFWSFVFIGSFSTILISGILSDRFGRKTPIVMSTYGIVLASLIIGVINQHINDVTFIITSLLIGISFSLIHPSLDSSLWADLASRDSIGRYTSLNIQSLGLGFIIGFAISYWLFIPFGTSIINYNVFILIGLAVFASLPLFWISDSFPPLEFFLLLVINDAGIPIFNHNFGMKKDLKVDLPLISGALSAVGNFMHEATGEKGARLNLVRHGSHFILSDENELGLSAAVFSNKNDPELQKLLRKFLSGFEKKYREILPTWSGNLQEFKDATNDAEEIFGPLVTTEEDFINI